MRKVDRSGLTWTCANARWRTMANARARRGDVNQALFVFDVQPSFVPPGRQVEGVARLARLMRSVAKVERHDEHVTRFSRQLGCKPAPDARPMVSTGELFMKRGCASPAELLRHLWMRTWNVPSAASGWHLHSRGLDHALRCGP